MCESGKRLYKIEIGQGEANSILILEDKVQKYSGNVSETAAKHVAISEEGQGDGHRCQEASSKQHVVSNELKKESIAIKSNKTSATKPTGRVGLPVIVSLSGKSTSPRSGVSQKRASVEPGKGDSKRVKYDGSDDTSATESDDVLDIGFKQEYACKKCRFQTYIHFKFHRHLLEHSDGAAVECPYCMKTIAIFVAKDAGEGLTSTEKSPKGSDKQPRKLPPAQLHCPFCQTSMLRLSTLKSHLVSEHAQELENDERLRDFTRDVFRTTLHFRGEDLSCSFCEWKSSHHFNYHRHLLKHCSASQNTICPYCFKLLSTELSTCGYGVQAFNCTECDQAFHSYCHLCTHQYLEHGVTQNGNVVCSVCGYRCHAFKHLSKHHAFAHPDQELVLTAETEEALEAIEEREKLLRLGKDKEKQQYKCTSCGFKCSRYDTLKKHEITHIPEESRQIYSCPEENCWFETFSKVSLNVHMSGKHKREQRASDLKELTIVFACDVCCDFTSSTEEELFAHQEHLCSVERDDGKKLRMKNVRAPSGTLIKYACSQCKVTATRRWNIIRHKQTAHTTRELISCSQCDYRTKHAKFMLNHYKRVHMLDVSRVDPMTSSTLSSLVSQEAAEASAAAASGSMRGVFTVCASNPDYATELKNRSQCEVCKQFFATSLLNDHMKSEHGGVAVFHCYAAGCNFVTASAESLAAHLSTHHTSSAGSQKATAASLRNKRAQHKCARHCGFVTSSVIALRNHHAHTCPLSPMGSFSLEDEPNLGDIQETSLTEAGDDVLLRAMNSISEITEAMKASGIEKPVIQQQGRTIFITIDKEDILKKQLKENLLKLNAMTSGDGDGGGDDSATSQIQYILNANNEMTVYDDVDVLQSSVQKSMALEKQRDVVERDVAADESTNDVTNAQVDQWINVPRTVSTKYSVSGAGPVTSQCATEQVAGEIDSENNGDLFYDTL